MPYVIQTFSHAFTLRIFLWDASVCKHRTWQIVRNLLNFYHSLHVWYHKILTNLMIFRLFFLNLKTIRSHVRGRISWTRCSKFLFISRVRPHTGHSNMNIIFHSFYSIIWITCSSNLTDTKNSLKSNKLIKYSKRIQKYTKS